MNNELFLKNYKDIYNSLNYFTYQDNFLIFHINEGIKIPLTHVNLVDYANSTLYYLSPNEIFQVIYMLEILYLSNLTEGKINYIKDYTKKYLDLYDKVSNNETDDELRYEAISIPINLSYNDEFNNMSASMIIKEMINNHLENTEKSRGNGKALVLSKHDNPNFEMVYEENPIETVTKAGFTTIILIATTITLTCLYLAYFVINH